jgi:ribosomal protein L37AE/L43A
MARMLLVTALMAAITVPLAGAADPPSDGTLSVKRGRGALVLKLKGTVIGRVKNGRVQIRDFRPLDTNDPIITCPRNRIRHVGAGIWICKARNISFRVADGRFNVNVRGTGIWISAVGRGPGTVDGTGDQGFADGVMSIDDAPYTSLPDTLMSFFLGTPVPPARS